MTLAHTLQEEEIGLRGAFALDPSLLTGRTMLNLDTEEAEEIYIGCAGRMPPTLLMLCHPACAICGHGQAECIAACAVVSRH